MKKGLYLSFGVILALMVLMRLILMPLYTLADPTEGRYAELAHQMILTGNWTTPSVWIEGHLMPFLGKPPLSFWLSAICMKFFGVNEFAPRFASLLGGLLVLGMVWTVCRRYLGRTVAETAVLVTFSSGVFWVLSGFVGTDMLLSGTVAIAFFAYFAWLNEERFWPGVGWSTLVCAGLGLSVLTKGMVGILSFGLPIFLWHCLFGDWKRLLTRRTWGIGAIVFLLITVPWFVIEQHEMAKKGIDFIRYFVVEEHFRRFISTDYYDPYGTGHIVPHGIAILYMFLTCAPWTLLALLFFWKPMSPKWTLQRNPLWENPKQAYFFLGFAAMTLFWCLGKQFLITYMLPLVASFAVWFALKWQDRFPGTARKLAFGALGLTFLTFLGVGIYLCFLFETVTPRQAVRTLIQDTLPKLDLLSPTGKWKIVVGQPERRSSPYFYGELAGRLVLDTEPGFFRPSKPRLSPFLFPYVKRSPLLALTQSDSRLSLPEALRAFDWKPDELVLIDQDYYLRRVLGLKFIKLNKVLFGDRDMLRYPMIGPLNGKEDPRYATWPENGEKMLTLCDSTAIPRIEMIGIAGRWVVLRYISGE